MTNRNHKSLLVDASPYGLEAVHSHVMLSKVKSRKTNCFSISNLNKIEQKYSAGEGGISNNQKFHNYRKFEVITLSVYQYSIRYILMSAKKLKDSN